MEFSDQFERDFINRTLRLVREYKGPSDATLLLNCMVGLLIVPKEKFLDRVPDDPLADLKRWGIEPSSIATIGKLKNDKPATLRDVVHRLRNSVAHSRFQPLHAKGKVSGFRYTDQNGFDASVSLKELRLFVERLATHLESGFGG